MNLRGAEREDGDERPVRLLLIEDDDAWAEIVLEKLKSIAPPYQVRRVSDSPTTLEALSEAWDLVVLDFDLQSMDAAGLLSSIRERAPQLPVIVVAGSFGDEIAVNAMKRGAHDVVLKHNARRLLPAIVQGTRDGALRREARDIEERHSATWKQTAVGIAHGSVDGRIIAVNDTFARMLGRAASELQGLNFADVTHPEDRSLSFEKIGRLLAGEPSASVEKRFIRPDGEAVWVLATFTLARKEDSEPYVIGIIQDISAWKAAERRLQENERRTRELMEGASDAILIGDEEMRVVDVNRAACAMTGYSREEVMGLGVNELIVLNGTGATLASLRSGNAIMVECEGRRKDGSTFPVEVSASVLSDGRFQAFVRDISKRNAALASAKKWQAQAEQAERMSSLGRVAATIAHEFNNVLMGIQPFAELIRRRVPGDEKLQQATGYIESSIRRGKRVTSAILNFTQAAAPKPARIDTGEWLRGIGEELRSTLGSAYELVLLLPEPSISIFADRAQLTQAIMNVVLNARDAMPSGGQIQISVGGAEGSADLHPEWRAGLACITVTDHGGGIPPEVEKQIFEPLFTTKKGSAGLGLALTHQVVTRNGGHIVVDTSGVGTSIHLLLPQIDAEQAGPDLPQEALPSANRPGILIVEDDEAVATGMAAMLEMEGFPTNVVRTGGEAEGAIRRFDPQVVILDIGLPDIDGIELFCALAEKYPDLRYIIATGHATRARVDEIKVSGRTAFLQKPFEISVLIDVIEELEAKTKDEGGRMKEEG